MIQGKYEELPKEFSEDLEKVIKQMLQVKSADRPSAPTLLLHQIVKTKAKELDLLGTVALLIPRHQERVFPIQPRHVENDQNAKESDEFD